MKPIFPSDEDPAGWGAVPTTDGTVASATPSTPTGTSTTQTTQSSGATTQSLAQSVFLPPAPVWTPVLDGRGMMTSPWVTWFATLNRKLGGYTATPTDDAMVLGMMTASPDGMAAPDTSWFSYGLPVPPALSDDAAVLAGMGQGMPQSADDAMLLALSLGAPPDNGITRINWTPTLLGDSTPGTGQTYGTQEGTAVLVGGMLAVVRFRLTVTGLGTAAGNAMIGGLPWPLPATNQSGVLGKCGGVTFPAGITALTLLGKPSTTTAWLSGQGTGVAAALVPVANVTATSDLVGTLVYPIF